MTEDAVDQRPRRVGCPAAPYPAAARGRGVQGHVIMRLLVGEAGEVERVKVVEAEPAGVFEAGAQDAMRRCRFEPARYQGRPVKVWAEQRVVFKLSQGGLGG
ncbi:MAG: energy transducer TonB [bacterium]